MFVVCGGYGVWSVGGKVDGWRVRTIEVVECHHLLSSCFVGRLIEGLVCVVGMVSRVSLTGV